MLRKHLADSTSSAVAHIALVGAEPQQAISLNRPHIVGSINFQDVEMRKLNEATFQGGEVAYSENPSSAAKMSSNHLDLILDVC